MAKIIEIKAFETGEFAISSNQYTAQDLSVYIDKYEKNYLEDMLGVELAELLLADLDQSGYPQSPRFQAIFGRFSKDYEQNGVKGILRSDGIPATLKAFVWCEYVKDQNVKNTISGSTVNEQEVSAVVSFRNAQFIDRYNETLKSYGAIQQFCFDNMEQDYPEFNGVVKQPKTII